MENSNQSTPSRHLIAGASRGIGRSLVDQSIAAGHQVYALSRTPPASTPTDCQWIIGDVSNPASFADQLPEQIDALTYCPGKVVLGPLKRLRPEQVLEAYQTNVLDAFTLIQSLLPKLSGVDCAFFIRGSTHRIAQPLCYLCRQVRTGGIWDCSRC